MMRGLNRRLRITGSALLAGLLGLTLSARWNAACADPPAVDDQQAQADEAAKPKQKWVRVTRETPDGDAQTMDTAIVRYADPERPELVVDLIAAVHVGDSAYYKALNKRFERYDALLYELVAPEGHVPEPGQGTSNAHPVGALQNGMKQILELEHQMACVDYSKDNFVHADMSPEEFAKSMSERNESFLQMFFRAMGQGMAMQSKQQAAGRGTDLKMFTALFQKNRGQLLKRAMADQFEDLESMVVSLGGTDGSAIITDRNQVALKVLEKQIKKGKKKIGIFYGAGHMADMDEHLRQQFGLKPVKTSWLTAWDIRDKE